MIGSFAHLFRRFRGTLYYSVLPRSVDALVAALTMAASQRLKAANVERVLIDNTVLAHAVTHETTWIDTGKSTWGGKVEVNTGHAARIPVLGDDDKSDAARSIRYLPGIASLARRGHLTLALSDELRDEQMTQPVGRFSGYGYYDYSLFRGVHFEAIPDPQYSVISAPSWMRYPDHREQRKQRLDAKHDAIYRGLVSVLGPSSSQDAWHIATAEHSNCYCFLTMDFKLVRNVRSQARNKSLRSLATRVLTPEEFGREFGISPVSPRLFSYHDASFPVIHRENWPDSRRQRPRKHQT